jgi:hypothetical protein
LIPYPTVSPADGNEMGQYRRGDSADTNRYKPKASGNHRRIGRR